MPNLMTVNELAKWLKVSPQTVYIWSANGKIPVLRLSEKSLRYDPDAVLRALTGQQSAAETTEASTGK